MNKELSQGLPIKYLQLNNRQDEIQSRNDQLDTKENTSLNYHNYFKYQTNEKIMSAQISNDEHQLAIGKQRKISIYSTKNKKLIKIIKLDGFQSNIAIIKFSNNSRYIIFGDDSGCLTCYDISQNYKIIHNQKVHSRVISDMLTIDDDQILTCSYDKTLIITNIIIKQQILKIENAHNSLINGIDFDKTKDFIISCSYDKSIKFFNRKDGKVQIEQQNAHDIQGFGIEMVQLLSKSDSLISSDYELLILWKIDYKGQQLNKLKQFKQNIYNFASILNNNNVVAICQKSVKILDDHLNVLQSIKHHSRYIDYYFRIKQLNQLNYIIVPGYYNLLILKKLGNKLK